MSLYANSIAANNGCISPANAYGAPDGTWTGNDGDTEPWDCRWGMGNPSGDLDGTQTLNIFVRKNATGGNGDPTVSAEVYEDGTLLATPIATTAVSSATGVTLSGTWSATPGTDQNNISYRLVVGGPGGMPAGRRSVQVDSIEWVAELDSFPALDPTLTAPADLAVVADPVFEWTFNTDNDGEAQEAFAFRVTHAAQNRWWTGSGWSDAETWITSGTLSVSILSEDFEVHNEEIEWSVATRETTNGQESGYPTPRRVTISYLGAPSLVAPADGVDHDGQDFSWNFNAPALGGTQTEFAFSRMVPDGEEIVASEESHGITDEVLHHAYNSDFSQMAATIRVETSDGTSRRFNVFDTSDWSPVTGVPTLATGGAYGILVRNVKWSKDDAFIGITGPLIGNQTTPTNEGHRIIRTSDWTEVSIENPIWHGATLNADTYSIEFSPDGAKMALGGRLWNASQSAYQPVFHIYDTTTWEIEITRTPNTTFASQTWIEGFNWDIQDRLFVSIRAGTNPRMALYNTSTWATATIEQALGLPDSYPQMNPAKTRLAIKSSTIIRVYDTSTWELVAGVEAPPGTPLAHFFSGDGSLLLVMISGAPRIAAYDTATWGLIEASGIDDNRSFVARFGEKFSTFWERVISSDPFIVLSTFHVHEYSLETALAPEWWDGSAWTDVETYIVSTDESITFPLGSWT